ncbi:MAG: helix-turn-helix transcriptional regulator, partial [Microcoleus sp. C1-bin4]|nr:helix-turn-helix transcriptional regulator [Microcoleus sp. C1-bin4]
MLGILYENEICSAARSLELIGERWSLLILRDALFRGFTRFSDFQNSLNIAPNILTKRLAGFVESGIMETKSSRPGSKHYDYVLTEKGQELKPIIIALTNWGDRWNAPHGAP